LKTGAFSVLYAVISNMAIGCCFIPFLLLGWKKMRHVNAYWIIGIYWLLNGLVNLPELGLFTGSRWQEKLTFGYNLAETPLVILVFGFATSGRQRRNLLLLVLLFMIWEAILVSWKGYNFSTSALIIGSGLLLILACCITSLIQYVRRMEHTRFESSMVFVYAALLFAYGSFLIIYIFAHMHPNGAGTGTDSFLLYYISLLISAAVTSMGLWNYGIKKMHRHETGSRSPGRYHELHRN
jgi:drug/metabolite transporter (DMT)-like permease